jgi:hypothetical protein
MGPDVAIASSVATDALATDAVATDAVATDAEATFVEADVSVRFMTTPMAE